MTDIVAGLGEEIVPGRTSWRSDEGQTETVIHEGLPLLMQSLYDAEIASPTDDWTQIDLERGTEASRVTLIKEPQQIDDEAEGLINVEWELDRTVIRRKLRTHNKVTGPDVNKNQLPILDKLDKIIRKNQPDPNFSSSNFADASPETIRYFYLRRNGTDAYNESNYVLRRIERVSSLFIIKEPQSEINTVTPLPGGISALVRSVVNSLDDVEWLKQPIDLRNLRNNRFETSQEWWGGTPKWATLMYGGTYDPVPEGLIQ